jgi:acetyl-CoA acetyltransferase
MAVLLARLPAEIPGATVNRLCGSGTEAVSDTVRLAVSGPSSDAAA